MHSFIITNAGYVHNFFNSYSYDSEHVFGIKSINENNVAVVKTIHI